VARTLSEQHDVVQVPPKGKRKVKFNKHKPRFPMPEGVSPVALLRLPDYREPYTMTVSSSPTGWGRTQDIFVPGALLFDADFQQTRVLSDREFKVKDTLMKGSHLAAVIAFDEPQRTERFLLMYTRADSLGQQGRVNVTVIGEPSVRGAIEGAAASAIASLLMRVERSTHGSIEVETRPKRR
jgi:hypothetical protein